MAKDVSTRVTLRDRYDIFVDQPLPVCDFPPALAYAARARRDDRQDLVAIVCDPALPPRFHMIAPLGRLAMPSLMTPVDWGVLDWPPERRRCPIFLFDPPQSERLLPAPDAHFEPMHEDSILRWVVNPIYTILRDFKAQGLVHRAIRPENIYLDARTGERFKLGQCLALPPAANQPAVYEPINSGLSLPHGRGEGSQADDLYALGVTMLACLIGRRPMGDQTEEAVVQAKLAKGSYGALTQDIRVSLSMSEVLRGLLNDEPAEQWSLEELGQWANGRRGSSSHQGYTVRAARSFRHSGRDLYTCREIAHALHRDWDNAAAVIRSGALDQWLRRALGDEKKVDAVNSAKKIETAGSDDLVVARVCIALDPGGPIRLREFACRVGGLAGYLAVHGGDVATMSTFRTILNNDLLGFWLDNQIRPPAELIQTVNELRAAKEHLERDRLGEGPERAIYELNRHLPCRSPLVESYYALDPDQLLSAYGRLASEGTAPERLIDRHVAAFLCTHATSLPSSALRDIENRVDPHLPAIAAVRLLSSVQERNSPPRLQPEVSALAAGLLASAIGRFHGKTTRKQVEAELKKAAKSGRLQDILDAVDNQTLLLDDARRFDMAVAQYCDILAMLERLDYEQRHRHVLSRQLGAQVSSLISGTLSIVSGMAVILVGMF